MKPETFIALTLKAVRTSVKQKQLDGEKVEAELKVVDRIANEFAVNLAVENKAFDRTGFLNTIESFNNK